MHVLTIAYPRSQVALQFKGPTAANDALTKVGAGIFPVSLEDDFGRKLVLSSPEFFFAMVQNMEQAQEGNIAVATLETESQMRVQRKFQQGGNGLAMPGRPSFHG